MLKKLNRIERKNNALQDLLGNNLKEPFVADYGSIKEYYLSQEIGTPEEYIDWFHEIRNCRESDLIKIHINCPGGNLFTTIQFMQALAETSAHIIASVEGACMSAATLIFLMADEFLITNHSRFLFHNYSGATSGKGGEMYHGMVNERSWAEKLLKEMYSDFLTDAEIDNMLNDKDIWMDADEVLKRLEKRSKILEKEFKKANAVPKKSKKAEEPVKE